MKQARRTFLKQATTAAGILAVPPVFRASTALAEGTKADKDGWRPLFDGKTLAGWKPQPRDIKYPSLKPFDQDLSIAWTPQQAEQMFLKTFNHLAVSPIPVASMN